ncbi:MAG: V-type ATP synthase subunit I [Bacilli bacterium]|nr:V-type ATP synthase subunit I [Bacilli bacterium]
MIIAMKKARLVVLKEDQSRVLQALQQQSIIMPIATEETPPPPLLDDPFIQRAEKTLKVLKQYQAKKKLGSTLTFTYSEFMEKKEERGLLVEETEKLEERRRHTTERLRTLKEELKDLDLWKDLDLKLSSLSILQYAIPHTGLIPNYNLEKIKAIFQEHAVEYTLLGQNIRHQALLFITYYEEDAQVVELLKGVGFDEVLFPKVDLTILDLITDKETELKQCEDDLKSIEASLIKMGEAGHELQLLVDQMETESVLKQTPLTQTLETVYLEGWIRSDQVETFESLMKKTVELYDLDIVDPEAGETPPTALKNNWFTRIFEPITNTFSVPYASEVDPNPVMAPWYWLLFGMMMGDVGYGVIMLLLIYIAIRVMKPKKGTKALMQMIMVCGVSTIIWGILFGSYFGVTWMPLLVEPMNDPMKMLLISMAVGAFHVLFGVGMKGYNLIVQKKYFDAVADSLSWILIILGIGLYAVGMMVPSLSTIGIILAGMGVLIVVFTAGRANKGIAGKITKGLTSLYGITGYVSDIISYSRILALGLSTASISFVMNLLAGMIPPPFGYFVGPIILLFGHTLNLVMSLLSAYVHTSRLQYIEFFGKFYEGNGTLFRPLSLQLKYVDEIHHQA